MRLGVLIFTMYLFLAVNLHLTNYVTWSPYCHSDIRESMWKDRKWKDALGGNSDMKTGFITLFCSYGYVRLMKIRLKSLLLQVLGFDVWHVMWFWHSRSPSSELQSQLLWLSNIIQPGTCHNNLMSTECHLTQVLCQLDVKIDK